MNDLIYINVIETIKDLIINKFDGGLSEEELSHSFDLRNNIDITKLFQLIEYSTQIQFDPQVYANLRKNIPITLSKRDIVKFGIKVIYICSRFYLTYYRFEL